MWLEEGAPLYYELNLGGFIDYAQVAGFAQSYFDEEIVLVLGTHLALRHHLFARTLSHEYFHLLQRQVQQKANLIGVQGHCGCSRALHNLQMNSTNRQWVTTPLRTGMTDNMRTCHLQEVAGRTT